MPAPPPAVEHHVDWQVEQHPPAAREDITSRAVALRLVHITLPNGAERHVPIALDHKPQRQQQKIVTLRRYVQRHPRGWYKRIELGHLLYATGHWEEAISEYQHVLWRQPGLLPVSVRLGEMLHLLRREAEAITVYKTALDGVQGEAVRHYIQGRMALCHQLVDDAVQDFATAVALESSNAAYQQALGLAYLNVDHPEASSQAFDQALAIDPDDLVALTHGYDALCAIDRLAEAEQRLEHALSLDPGNVLAITKLVHHRCRMEQVYGRAGRQTQALLRRAVRLAPEVADVQAVRAHFHRVRGEREMGLAILEAFTAQHPHSPAGWSHYAQWRLHASESDAAADAIRRAYTLDPHDIALYRAMCAILSAAERPAIEANGET